MLLKIVEEFKEFFMKLYFSIFTDLEIVLGKVLTYLFILKQ